jgi:hypothetical protein
MARTPLAAALLALLLGSGCEDPQGNVQAGNVDEDILPPEVAEETVTPPEPSGPEGLFTAKVEVPEAEAPADEATKPTAPQPTATQPAATQPAAIGAAEPPATAAAKEPPARKPAPGKPAVETPGPAVEVAVATPPALAALETATETPAPIGAEASAPSAAPPPAADPGLAAAPSEPPPAAPALVNPMAGVEETAPRGPRLVAVRFGGHQGYDRVVFEFTGAMPSYGVDSLAAPTAPCNGQALGVSGTRWIAVRLAGLTADPSVLRTERTFDFPALREAELACRDGGDLVWVLGLARSGRTRVSVLDRPVRLVVDVNH